MRNNCDYSHLEINYHSLRQGRENNKFTQDVSPSLKFQTGFTLVELMIVVAIIGILAAVAVPNFIAYRDKARIAAITATSESIRSAMAAYSADSQSNLFPDSVDITNWSDLISIANPNGATLRTTETSQGMQFSTYYTIDNDSDSTPDDYYFIFYTIGVKPSLDGAQIEVRPSGITKQTLGAS